MKLPNRTLVLAASLLLFVPNAFAQNWAAQAPPYGRPDATVDLRTVEARKSLRASGAIAT